MWNFVGKYEVWLNVAQKFAAAVMKLLNDLWFCLDQSVFVKTKMINVYALIKGVQVLCHFTV